MTLLRFILSTSRRVVGLVVMIAVVTGAVNALLIAVLNLALHQERPTWPIAGGFLGLVLARLVLFHYSQIMLARFSQSTGARLRCRLAESILRVPLRTL